MSISFFLLAITKEQLAQMRAMPDCIDVLVDGKQEQAAIDLEYVGDVLRIALDGVGFACDELIEDVLSFGCMLIGPELVKVHATLLVQWERQRLIERVDALYEVEGANEKPNVRVSGDEVWPHFVRLQHFYQGAARQNWAVLIYLA